MKPNIFICFISLLVSCAGTSPNNRELTGYNIHKPSSASVLPDTLREISGLTVIDTSSFACVQDENGILFIYDAAKNKIKKQHTFFIDGDYEGIAKVNNNMYVLRSDGTLFEIINYDSEDFKLNTYTTGIPTHNNEGLCYDKDNNRLLIASKGKMGKGHEYKDKRAIFAFDLSIKMLNKKPVFDFNVQTIKKFAIDNGVNLPVRKKGKAMESVLKFTTSAIAIHPLTKKLYLLSSHDHMLFIFDLNGNIEHIEQLDAAIFNKAEGISFFENGDMLITNEGQNKKPTLLRFDYTSGK